MNWLDPIGACLSISSTFFFIQAQRFAWIISIFAIFVNSILYWQKGIYGHLLLEAIYLLSTILGWIMWSTKANHRPTRLIRYLSVKECYGYLFSAVIGVYLFSQALITFSDSDIPYWDATTTVLSILAQWLLCQKIIHCWILWFIVDAMVAGLQLYKGIPFHSAVHWLYLLMAVVGYFRWLRLYREQEPVIAAFAS